MLFYKRICFSGTVFSGQLFSFRYLGFLPYLAEVKCAHGNNDTFSVLQSVIRERPSGGKLKPNLVHCQRMAVYKTRCDVCPSEFNTTLALLKHRNTKHGGARAITFLPFYDGECMIQLPGRARKGRHHESYKQWLIGIVESINSCLHPKAKGN